MLTVIYQKGDVKKKKKLLIMNQKSRIPRNKHDQGVERLAC